MTALGFKKEWHNAYILVCIYEYSRIMQAS